MSLSGNMIKGQFAVSIDIPTLKYDDFRTDISDSQDDMALERSVHGESGITNSAQIPEKRDAIRECLEDALC